MPQETRARQNAQKELDELFHALETADGFDPIGDENTQEPNYPFFARLTRLSQTLSNNGMADLALKGCAALYVERFDDLMAAADVYDLSDVREKPLIETIRADLVDRTVILAPKAIQSNPATTAKALGRMLTAIAIIYPEKVTKYGGFTTVRLTQLHEQFHRAIREVAKRFNKGETYLINPYLGELGLRHEEDYRFLRFPHQRTTLSVMLAHGGNSGNFGDIVSFLRCHDCANKEQYNTASHFAKMPQKIPNDGRRVVPVQGLLFGSGW